MKNLLYALTLMLAIQSASSVYGQSGSYEEILWIDLLPPEDYEALLNPPQIDHNGPETPVSRNSLRRSSDNALFEDDADARLEAFNNALVSRRVRPEMDETQVRLPGFIVPLDYREDMVVVEFFLVPYFGACIHLPPPPPNQIVHVVYPEGLPLSSIWDPYYVEGKLTIERVSNEIGESAYRITADAVTLYQE